MSNTAFLSNEALLDEIASFKRLVRLCVGGAAPVFNKKLNELLNVAVSRGLLVP